MDPNESTQVTQTDINIDELLAAPGADSIVLPDDKKPSLFTNKPVDLSFLDKPEDTLSDEEKADKIKTGELNEDGTKKVVPGTVDDIDNLIVDDNQEGKTGRPKLDKQGLVELTNKLIEKKLLIPFDDDKPIDKYTMQDFEELFEANAQEKERKLSEEVHGKFFEALPEELQYAAKYVADGGRDMKGLFRMLAATEEVKSLDPTDENDSEAIVRTYLQATNFGSSEDIQEEIDSWKDRNELEAKARKFKPKLDQMQEEILAYKIQEQEQLKKQQQDQARAYMANIYKALEPGEINGIKLDKKVQSLLYAGLTQPNYPSVSGKQTNLLGHLLEKYQFVEPNHGLIAEALWLLADPDGYKSKVREIGEKKAIEKTVRALKSEESRKIASGAGEEDDNNEKKTTYKIPRPGNNFFKRT